jgi:hypothetical protein
MSFSARPQESFKVLRVQVKIHHQKEGIQTIGQETSIDVITIPNLNLDLVITVKHVAPLNATTVNFNPLLYTSLEFKIMLSILP